MKNSRVRIRIHHPYMDKEKKLVCRYIPVFGQNSSILHRSGHFLSESHQRQCYTSLVRLIIKFAILYSSTQIKKPK
jgi:hypothetical protein